MTFEIFMFGLLVVSVLTGLFTEATFNLKMAVYLIALVLLSWLAAMVGYDKVIQSITQFKKGA